MPRINLLPWREELRQKRKKEFLLAVLGAVLMGAAFTFATKFYYQQQIANQESRNTLLRNEIADLDRQIAEIDELDAQKARLLARMEIIDELQRSRPEAVHLVDEAVNILPEGTHLTALRQTGSRIEIAGITQSTTRVSTLMRNIEASQWLKDESLLGGGIESSGSGPSAQVKFTLYANQIRMSDEGDL